MKWIETSVKLRGIKGYKTMSKERLLSVLSESESVETAALLSAAPLNAFQ